MLYKGKHKGYYLYELTETDLAWEPEHESQYQLANVLLFSDKREIKLGKELAKADDLAAAYDYLDGKTSPRDDKAAQESILLKKLQDELELSNAGLKRRDELLRDLTEDLESQRTSNKVLIAQLQTLREQVSIEQLTKNEVLGDLEFASAETYRKDRELQKAIDDKTRLEQELAARICELLELDSANSDLQKRLEQQASNEAALLESSQAKKASASPTRRMRHNATQILTTHDGKQVQVYHEFPAYEQTRAAKFFAATKKVLKLLVILLAFVLIFLAGSVVATALFNDISFGEALDLSLSSVAPR